MKINLEVNEARILKLATDGISMKNIEETIAKELKSEIKYKVKQELQSKLENTIQFTSKHFDNLFSKQVKEKLINDVKQVLTPKRVKSLLKTEDWDSFLNDTVGQVLADFVSSALEEHALIDINVLCNGKKKKEVSMAGKDSYTHRRK